VTRGRLPQRAGLPGLKGGGTAAMVPRQSTEGGWLVIQTALKISHQDHHTMLQQYSMLQIHTIHDVNLIKLTHTHTNTTKPSE